MKWQRGHRSANVEDRRGGGGGGRRRAGGMKLGLGGILVLGVLSLVFKQNFFTLLDGGGSMQTSGGSSTPYRASPQEQETVEFVSFVLDDAQKVMGQKLREANAQYSDAKLVLFSGSVRSACGYAGSATGPFYCPADHKVYIDLSFYQELATKFGAPGDFAQAYVLAHEVGHHVQTLVGTSRKVRAAQAARPSQKNQLQVSMELQADCYAGVWAHSTGQRKLLEAGDIQEGLGAAAAVGDDRIQKQARGYVTPESFTHGSSKQRMEWFMRGYKSGRIQDCDTFSGN